jgi:hypothetical protein
MAIVVDPYGGTAYRDASATQLDRRLAALQAIDWKTGRNIPVAQGDGSASVAHTYRTHAAAATMCQSHTPQLLSPTNPSERHTYISGDVRPIGGSDLALWAMMIISDSTRRLKVR